MDEFQIGHNQKRKKKILFNFDFWNENWKKKHTKYTNQQQQHMHTTFKYTIKLNQKEHRKLRPGEVIEEKRVGRIKLHTRRTMKIQNDKIKHFTHIKTMTHSHNSHAHNLHKKHHFI